MMDIYKSLTEDDGHAGILKNLLEEPELDKLMKNPFRITRNDIVVSRIIGFYSGSNGSRGNQ